MFLVLFLKKLTKIFGSMLTFHQRVPHRDFNVMSLGIDLVSPTQQLLEIHLKNTEMTSIQDVKPRISKFLHSQTEDKHAEHFSGA